VTDEKLYSVNPDAIWEVLDGEVIIANLDGGSYYSLGGSGVAIWGGLAAGKTVDIVIAEVSDAVGQDPGVVGEHARDLVGQLVAESLITQEEGWEPGDGSRPGPSPSIDTKWVAPVFDKYTDMQQLLMLDPIHDVDESGWPAELDPN
jgi:hypothetical protein